MHVKDIRLINFRNYFNLAITFNKGTNVIVGQNAQGKTNLLEAIYICAMGRSFRTNRDREIINFKKNEAYVGANIEVGKQEKFIEVKMERDKTKRIRINKNELKNYKELYSGLNVVAFTPEDLVLVKGGPGDRRSFLDMEISQIKPLYSFNINKYQKILNQRNYLLKNNKFHSNINNLLEIFDLQLGEIGTEIVLERNRYINELSQLTNKVHKDITLNNENVELDYLSNIDIIEKKSEMKDIYIEKLRQNMKKDIELGSTQLGPHRDDISININKRDLKTFGSQGQQRTAVLSIKLAEVDLIKKQRGMYPVLLLDDVFSELDESRSRYLIKSVHNMQTFITTTDEIDLIDIDNKSIFCIEEGKLL